MALLISTAAFGQFNIGIKVGANTTDIGATEIEVPPEGMMEGLKIAIEKAHYGFNFGAFMQVQAGWFLVQPEVIFNSTRVDFMVNDRIGNYADRILTDSYQNLDIPLLLGLKAGPLRIQAGPVGHLPLKYMSNLSKLEGFSSDFSPIDYGFLAGIGIDFYNFMLDLRYEGNFNKFGDYITFYGHKYNFSDNPTRLLLSVAVGINK